MNRDKQKKATGLKILLAAKQLFKEQGYEATSTRQIAVCAGVATGTVFTHFKDKHELIKSLFFSELEAVLTQHKPDNEQGALKYFSQQTLCLYQFYEKDRSLAKAFLKNALFEQSYFEGQLNQFVQLLCDLLKTDLPDSSVQQREVTAKAWMGFYFMTLLSGLGSANTTAKQWHQSLIEQCQTLLLMTK